jgi:hypothetical protein
VIEPGKQYRDTSGTLLGQMNTCNGPIGDFWCAMLGDGRYFTKDGVCVALFGKMHHGNNVAPGPEFNICFALSMAKT